MKRKLTFIIAMLMALILVFANSSVVFADGEEEQTEPSASSYSLWPAAPDLLSGSCLMIEANTQAVLYSKNPDEKIYPASTTKLLTCLVALENSTFDETVTFSENAVNLEDDASNIGAVAGEQMTMKDCLYGLMVASGNECANAIAEHIAGSIPKFAEMMNRKAEELGCTGSHFVNPHGLFDENHYTTAADMLKIAQAAFNNSSLLDIISQASYTIKPTNKTEEERTLTNSHYMILPHSEYYNEYVVGGKTGYLVESGRCLITLAKKDNMTIICVTMFCPTYTGVFSDTQELLDYAFNNFSIRNISQSEIRFGYADDKAKVVVDSTSQLLLPNKVAFESLDSRVHFTYDMDMDEYAAAKEAAGITTNDGRHLYAIMEYSLDDHYLGKVNVFLNDNLEITKAGFTQVVYVNLWFVLIIVGAVIIVLIAFFEISGKKRAKAQAAVRRPVRR
ncbi:MAG: D-alanyl-D-alanine carboxypeptidase [Lachnospiraceae bacterium]|nr:D-alanyl-D-alanine carboxypeptidase [Lachnospiraceae bacterium]